jgi:anthranilate phosphoribosyltransferase
LLLRGTEGESVADARRTPAMDVFKNGQIVRVQEQHAGALQQVPELPGTDAPATAQYIQLVLQGELPVPQPIALQVQHILNEVTR